MVGIFLTIHKPRDINKYALEPASLDQNFRRLWWSMNNCGRCSVDLPKCPQICNRKYVSFGKISAASSVCIGIRRWGKGVKNNFQASDLYKLTSHLPTTGARWNLCFSQVLSGKEKGVMEITEYLIMPCALSAMPVMVIRVREGGGDQHVGLNPGRLFHIIFDSWKTTV